MKLSFEPNEHKYTSDEEPDKKWISVTTLIEKFSPKEDFEKIAEKISKSKKSKWYGLSKEEILQAWSDENKRSTDLGTWYHEMRENKSYNDGVYIADGKEIPVVRPLEEMGLKVSSEQQLKDGYYPEHLCYLKSNCICGQSDVVIVHDGVLDIKDYKTNKKIDRYSYSDWNGVSKKMLPPLQHLDDCNLSHYALQLSMYMYMILKHNPQLTPGTIEIIHASFKKEGENKYGYPIYKKDENGNFIVESETVYEVAYMKKEIQSILKYMEKNDIFI